MKASDAFLAAYLECALWSSTDNSRDDGGDPLDENYSAEDFAPEALAEARKDCDNFAEYAAAEMAQLKEEHGADDDQNGHDFWLTRNRHGAGFWDRGYGKTGTEASDKAKSFGSADIYVGSDGKLHFA